VAGQTEGEKQAERWGTMTQRMDDMAGDIGDLKTGLNEVKTEQVKQGKDITRLNVKVAIAGAFGGMIGSLVVGLILLFAQKGSP
jgi:hypothetical protein